MNRLPNGEKPERRDKLTPFPCNICKRGYSTEKVLREHKCKPTKRR